LSDLKPYFGQPSLATASHAKTFGTRLYNFGGSNLSELAANVLWGLRNISELLEAIHDGKASPDTTSASDLQFTDRVEVLERLVHPLWYVEDPTSPQHVIFSDIWVNLFDLYIYYIPGAPSRLGMNSMLAIGSKLPWRRVEKSMSPCHLPRPASLADVHLGQVADAREAGLGRWQGGH